MQRAIRIRVKLYGMKEILLRNNSRVQEVEEVEL